MSEFYDGRRPSYESYPPSALIERWRISRILGDLASVFFLNQLILTFGGFAVYFVLSLAAEAVPGSSFALWLEGGEFDDFIMLVLVPLAFLPVYFYNRRIGLPLPAQLRRTTVSARYVLAAFVICYAVNSLGAYIYMAFDSGMQVLGYSEQLEFLPGDTVFAAVCSLLYGVVIAPVFEEFVFRGTLLMSLRRYGDRFALVTSSLLFGLMHCNMQQFFSTVLIGFVLGYICLRTGSLRICILLHALNNLFVTVWYDYILAGAADAVVVWLDNLLSLAAIAGALVLLALFPAYFAPPQRQPQLPVSPYRAFFGLPLVVALLVFYILIIILGFSPV